MRASCPQDARYRDWDFSTSIGFDARAGFLQQLRAGEARMRMAEAALHVCAEDDALVSNSPVALPVESFLQCLDALADGLAGDLPRNGGQEALERIT